jgi:MFS family permease
VTFVIGSVLAAQANPDGGQHRSAILLALYFAGVGIGIVVSGLAVPAILSNGGGRGWQSGWIFLGLIAAAAFLPATAAAFGCEVHGGRASSSLDSNQLHHLTPTLAGYFLFGAGYVT